MSAPAAAKVVAATTDIMIAWTMVGRVRPSRVIQRVLVSIPRLRGAPCRSHATATCVRRKMRRPQRMAMRGMTQPSSKLVSGVRDQQQAAVMLLERVERLECVARVERRQHLVGDQEARALQNAARNE